MEGEETTLMKIDLPNNLYWTFHRAVVERKGKYKGKRDEALKEAIRQYAKEGVQRTSFLPPDLKEAVKTWCDNTGIRYENAIPMLVKIGFKARELLEVPPEARGEIVDDLIEFMKEKEGL